MIKSFNDMSQAAWGMSSDSVLEEFKKAVATGSGVFTASGAAMGDAGVLNLQNLDNVLTSVLFTEEHLELFGTLPRVPSDNVNWQFSRRTRYGGGRRAPGFTEGGGPSGGTAAWERDSATIRFMGVKGGITHPMIQTGKMGGSQLDPVAEENRDRTLELLEEVERCIFFGQEAIKDNLGRTVNYDGLLTQMQNSKFASKNVIDMKGQPMTFDNLEDTMKSLVKDYYVTKMDDLHCLASPDIISDFSKLRFNMQRQAVTTGTVQPSWAGAPFEGYTSNFGNVPFKSHLFFQRVTGDIPLDSSQGADPGSPAAPATITPTAGADSTGTSQIAAGSYYYSMASFNDTGESLPTVTAVIAATKGQAITLAIAQVTGATGYRIYRGLKSDGSDHYWIVDAPDAGSGGTSVVDLNAKMPNTGYCMIWLNNEETVAVPQFLPLLKWPLAIVSTTIEFYLLLYHTVKIKAPQRFFIFKNVGNV